MVAMKGGHREIILDRCKACEDKVVVWNIEDPYFLPQGYAERVFTQIKEKVDELASTGSSRSP